MVKFSEARDLLSAEASDGFARVGRDQYWLVAMQRWARVCAQLVQTGLAAQLYGWQVPWHAQIPFAGGNPQPPVCYALGRLATVLGDHDAAEHHFEELDAMAERTGAP